MTPTEEDRHRATRQEESRRRQAAVNVNSSLADQQEGERVYMTQRAAQHEADRLRAAQHAAQQAAQQEEDRILASQPQRSV